MQVNPLRTSALRITPLVLLVPLLFAAQNAAAQPAATAQPLPDQAFWRWYLRYADDNGDVFDPLDLAAAEAATREQPSTPGQDNEPGKEASTP